MWVCRQEIGGPGFQIGEITPPASGDTDFFGRTRRMVDDQNARVTRARARATEQASGPSAEYDCVKGSGQNENSLKSPIPALLAA